jgi:hypothetical protein
MLFMALPYTITMSITGLIFIFYTLQPATDYMYETKLLIPHHEKPSTLKRNAQTLKLQNNLQKHE